MYRNCGQYEQTLGTEDWLKEQESENLKKGRREEMEEKKGESDSLKEKSSCSEIIKWLGRCNSKNVSISF